MIDRTRYLASNMARLADDYSFKSIESAIEGALLKIEAAKEGKFECWIYEQDINKKDTTCRMSDLAAELRKLGYDTQVGRDKNDIELHVSWGDHFDGYNN